MVDYTVKLPSSYLSTYSVTELDFRRLIKLEEIFGTKNDPNVPTTNVSQKPASFLESRIPNHGALSCH